MITINVSSETVRTIEAFKTMPEKLHAALALSVDQSALEVMDQAKILAPYKSGNLRRSITKAILPSSNGLAQAVGTDVVYAAIHEFGGMAGRNRSVRIPARPYFRPAIAQKQSTIKSIFERNIAQVVK